MPAKRTFEVRLHTDDSAEVPEGLKVVLLGPKGAVGSAPLTRDRDGAVAKVSASAQPRRAVVVAETVADSEADKLDAPAAPFDRASGRFDAIRVPLERLRLLLAWCRTFIITGRVVCPDGSPVPAATVSAFDIDSLWFYTSYQQVGTAVTDAQGNFTIRFTWCCGRLFLPWWHDRRWRIDPDLLRRMREVLEVVPELRPIPRPDPVPDVRIVQPFVGERFAPKGLLPSVLADARAEAVARLPSLPPDLVELRPWPWFPWNPWFDCNPDIVFRVTQDCAGEKGRVIYADRPWNVRRDIPTHYSTKLVARDACCLPEHNPPEGDCVAVIGVCDQTANLIATAGSVAGLFVDGQQDRPYGGTIDLRADFGEGATFDRYEIEHRTGIAGWAPLTTDELRAIDGTHVAGSPATFQLFNLGPTDVAGRTVYRTRDNAAASIPLFWGWTAPTSVAVVDTTRLGGDGVHQFRVVGWRLVNGALVDRRVVPLCGSETDGSWTVRTANDAAGSAVAPVPPSVHSDTDEPDAWIVRARYNGSTLPPCSIGTVPRGGTLEIDFIAHDADGWLQSFSLTAHHGASAVADLLALGTLSAGTAAFGVPAATTVASTYAGAVAAGATRPTWTGGVFRLTLSGEAFDRAFPETCCYLLRLRTFNRTIVNCSTQYARQNASELSFTVQFP